MLNITDLFDRQITRHSNPPLIGVLPGEGIGPQLIDIVIELINTIERTTGLKFDVRFGGPIGKAALATHGSALTTEVESFCGQLFDEGGVLFCGPGGDRFVYDLRKTFGLFCKLAPIQPVHALAGEGPVERSRVLATDILVVRENMAGIYQGQYGLDNSADPTAWQRFEYQASQVDDILHVALKAASQRKKRVSVVTKPGGIPSISALWEKSAQKIFHASDVDYRILEVDNACYQIIARPGDFDVVVAPNLFGDVIGDVAALLLGSRGMSYSANYSRDLRCAVYQTSHGAAHDLAGKNVANPIAQILSLAMMLEQSFSLHKIAAAIRASVEQVLLSNHRSLDLASATSTVLGTQELGDMINDVLCTNLSNEV